MADVTLDSFKNTLNSLLDSNPHARNKGDVFKDWCVEHFGIEARISHIREQRQTTNRVSEQFRYFNPIVVFVCDSSVKREGVVKYVTERTYKQLATIAIVGVTENPNKDEGNYSYSFERLLIFKKSVFSDWAEPYFDSVEMMNPLSFNNGLSNKNISYPQQIIYYGAPGTGKSYKTNEVAKKYSTIRTTFHPDSDYSTFVGAYKPTTIKSKSYGLNSIGETKPIIDPETGKTKEESKIEYRFVKQAFLKAYVKAWKLFCKADDMESVEPQFLVIEEINRGNCAQIFGDIFQLLDRSDGLSEYPIEADEDIRKSLLNKDTEEDPSFGENGLLFSDAQKEAINDFYNKDENTPFRDVAGEIAIGKVLVLPSNFYIWATMNTSDQSLFPIDSAFKRRWDWQYMPIANGLENWYISVDEYKFDWWQFLQKINKLIGATTHSEDKKLGYYFCKARNKEIDVNLFVSKVIFYLWNDVFKDYEFANSVFDDIDGRKLTFDKFYTTINRNTMVVEDKVVMFLNKLDEAIDKEQSMLLPNVEATTGLSGNDFTNYSFEGSAPMGKSELGKTIMLKYLNENEGLTFDDIKTKFPDSLLGSVANKGLIVKDEENLGSYQKYYVGGFKSTDDVKFKIYKQWTVSNIQNIINFAFSQGWNVEEKGSWRRKDNNA